MPKQENFKWNLVLQIAYQFLSIAVPLVTMPYVSRVLGPDGVGQYSMAYNIAQYFFLFSMLGINVYASRQISLVSDDREKLHQSFSSLFYVHGFFSVLSLFCYFLLIRFYQPVPVILLYLTGINVLAAFFDIGWLFVGLEKIRVNVTRNSAVKILSILFIFLFVKDEGDLWIYTLIMTLSTLCSNGYMWLFAFRYVRFVRVSVRQLLEDTKCLLTFFLPAIAVSLYRYMDKLLVGILSTTTELGYYEQSEKIVLLAVEVIAAAGMVAVPRFTKLLHAEGRTAYLQAVKHFNLFVACLCCALGFGLAAVAPWLAQVYLGESFLACGDMIFILSMTVPVMSYAVVIRSVCLLPAGRNRIYILSAFVGAFANLAADFLLIPKYGAVGAIFGTVLAEFSVAVAQLFGIRRQIPILSGIGGGMFFLVRLLMDFIDPGWISLLLVILAGAIVYLLLSGLYVFLFQRSLWKVKIQAILQRMHKKSH